MKNKEIYQAMIKHNPVWVPFPLPYGHIQRCKILMVGITESILKSDSGVEFQTSNKNISEKDPKDVGRETRTSRKNRS